MKFPVSIPQRFDWNLRELEEEKRKKEVSIPQRFDWNERGKESEDSLPWSFHPSKVRLKLDLTLTTREGDCEFPSLKGSIETCVRLQRLAELYRVSIPQRFDWNVKECLTWTEFSWVSIPQRFDWNLSKIQKCISSNFLFPSLKGSIETP